MLPMRYFLLLFLSGCSIQPIVGEYNGPHGQLRAFVSDGCTGHPDGPQQSPSLWAHCCEIHDLKYWAGGSEDERLAADRELEACVARTGHGDTAKIMYRGVRIFGVPFNENSWRWGFGWTKLRGYTPLNEEERVEIERYSPKETTTKP
jgi:hypothetical protein